MVFLHSSLIGASRAKVSDRHARPGAIVRLAHSRQPIQLLAEAVSLRDGQAGLGPPGGSRPVAKHPPDGYRPTRQVIDHPSRLVGTGLARAAVLGQAPP